MTGEVGATGKGFLTTTGQVKDRKTLAAEEQQASKKSENVESNNNASESEFSEEKVASAFSSVRSRFSEDVNSVVSVINEDEEDLKQANDNVKKQLKAARELKQAIKEEDQETADAKREELKQLQTERDKLASQIEDNNRERADQRIQSVSFGNKPKAIVKIDKLEFEKSDPNQDLESKEGVNNLISNLQDDRTNIQAQRKELREVKKEVKKVVDDVRTEIGKIEKAAIASVDEAEKTANKIANQVIRGGAESSLVSKIDESVVKELVAS